MEQKILIKHLSVGHGTVTAMLDHSISKEFEIPVPEGWNVKQIQMTALVKDNTTRNVALAMLLEKD